MSIDKSILFKEANEELNKIIEKNDIDKFKSWKKELLKYLDGYYKFRLEKIDDVIEVDVFNSYVEQSYNTNKEKLIQIRTILRDMYFKYNSQKQKNKENIEIEKLLKARENNLDFEKELSEMICGDNTKFPYRSSYYLTDFFNKLGFDFTHSNETRRIWVEDRLKELTIKEIHFILSNSNGLFNRKYFRKHIDEFNSNATHSEMEINFDTFYKEAQKEFEIFIKDSINEEIGFNLSPILDLNVNIELLFESKANTNDTELNLLIEESKKRFLSNDKQIGLEKLWDSFERLKTYYDGDNKKYSAEKVVEKISESFDKALIDNEFTTLTKIGNDYRIRHHEKNKKELSNRHINYFFFRMLSLIDLYLMYYNEIEEEGS